MAEKIRFHSRRFELQVNVWISGAVIYHPVDPDEVFGLLGPRRQVHVAHHPPVLPHSQVVAAAVDEHLWQVVELGDELLRFQGGGEKELQGYRSATCAFIRGLFFFLPRHISNWRRLRVRDT